MTTEAEAEAQGPRLYARAVAGVRRYLAAVAAGQWDARTPCTDWDVRQLVSHMVSNAKRVPGILDGTGPQLFEVVLGDDLLKAFDEATKAGIAAFHARGAMERTVSGPRGEQTAGDYAVGMANEMLVHGWDLAKATGQDTTMDPELLEVEYARALRSRDHLRGSARWGDEVDVADSADLQARFLAILGRKA